MIKLKVDIRERELIQILKIKLEQNNSIELITENLHLGDIIIEKDENIILVIERKTINDLRSSIKDGRYKEQSYRLNGLDIHNHNIIYLIEGIIPPLLQDKNTIYSALFSLQYKKGFSIWRTNSIDESVYMLLNNINYLIKNNKNIAFYSNNISCVTETDGSVNKQTSPLNYANVIKSVKKQNITIENIGEIMLSQIPGVSVNSAISIIKHFNCLINLIAELQEQGEKCLENVVIINSTGESKRLSKTCISNIIKYLIS